MAHYKTDILKYFVSCVFRILSMNSSGGSYSTHEGSMVPQSGSFKKLCFTLRNPRDSSLKAKRCVGRNKPKKEMGKSERRRCYYFTKAPLGLGPSPQRGDFTRIVNNETIVCVLYEK